jgi:hypothetical protein
MCPNKQLGWVRADCDIRRAIPRLMKLRPRVASHIAPVTADLDASVKLRPPAILRVVGRSFYCYEKIKDYSKSDFVLYKCYDSDIRMCIHFLDLNFLQSNVDFIRQFFYQSKFKPISKRQFVTSEVIRILIMRHVNSR